MNFKFKYIRCLFVGLVGLFFLCCSTKKDNFATRNWQALNTKYNVLFNGNEALDKGVVDLNNQYNDNFWEILPIERQLPIPEKKEGEEEAVTKSPNFELAEDKGIKAVQKRSIYIDGTERNYQIDESYLLLGKARYYTNRFIPALEAFNYILYKYPTSSNIVEAKIWREKTNIRLDNDEFAIKNLKTAIAEIKEKNQIYANANAILAQAYIKIEQKDSAVLRLQNALEFTKLTEEKARYQFILGQLHQALNQNEKAFANYQAIIDLKRKSPRQYIIQAQARQAGLGLQKDSVQFLKTFNDLLEDRENRPFLDVLHHQVALFYDKNNNTKQAKKQYNLSLKNKKRDNYLEASNYRNLASIYFYEAKYSTAGKYYDSTLVKLNPKTKEHLAIKKKRENLDDVIKYEALASRNDSILSIVAMNELQKNEYFEKFVAKLKTDEAKEKQRAEKTNTKDTNQTIAANQQNTTIGRKAIMPPFGKNNSSDNLNGASNFYFYNAQTVAFGKTEFIKNWGARALKPNWRLNAETEKPNENEISAKDNIAGQTADPKYTADFYIKQLPSKQTEIAALEKDRNFAYYQLGVIYKEKFKEFYLAKDKLEALLTKNPEERLILPSMYNLYKIYEIIDANKAIAMKNEITARYPNSRYAQILNGTNNNETSAQAPEVAYRNFFEKYTNQDYRTLLADLETAVNQYSGEEIIAKMELLKANTIGKIKGLEAFKKALNYVALTYPNTAEGKKSEIFLANDVPQMESLQFNNEKPISWKILYKVKSSDGSKSLIEKITKFSNDRSPNKSIFSIDLFTIDENFVVLHGLKDEDQAKGVVTILKEYKDYKIDNSAIIINNYNYKVLQIKKNLEEYITNPSKVAQTNITVKSQTDTPENTAVQKNIEQAAQTIEKPKQDISKQQIEFDATSKFAPPETIEISNEPKKQ